MEKTYLDSIIKINDEGYLTDFTQWTREIGEEIAKEQEIEMTDKHWEVIDYIHDKYKKEEALSIRGIKKSGVINIK
jgi:TusE/DsrC/DsvC family sulfur relay protein